MKQASMDAPAWRNWLGGALLGAVAMYLSDPDRGRRRRAMLRDRLQSMSGHSGQWVDTALRDAGNRLQGLRAGADHRLLHRHPEVDDPVLEQRVRASLGRAIAHAHPVRVDAHGGRITLTGPVLAREKDALLRCVAAVPGVAGVDDRLDVHQEADGIPSLQGAGRHRAQLASPMRDTWPPSVRAAAVLGAGALGYYAVSRRSAAGLLLGAAGAGLALRAARNQPLLPGRQAGELQTFDLYKTVHVEAAPEAVYDHWSRYENFPQFMSNVIEVRDLGGGRSHWVVSGPAASRVEWDAVLTESVRPWVLAWQSEPGEARIRHAGAVRLEPADTGTRVSVQLSYRPAEQEDSRLLAMLFRGNPSRQLEDDLSRMKSFIESHAPAGAGAVLQPDRTLH